MSKFLSGRERELRVGIVSYTENNTVLQVVGNTNVTGIVTASGGFNLGISSAGTSITSGPVTTLNFIDVGNTFVFDGTTVDISIAGGGGGGLGTAISYDDGKSTPFSYIDREAVVDQDVTLDTANAGESSTIIVSVIPNITIASGVGLTVGLGKTMVIDVLQIGDL